MQTHVFSGMQNKPDKSADVWIQLARAHSQILRSTEAALKSSNLPGLSWYDVLLEVERSGRNGLRPFELEERMLLPQYGVSRLVDRIEKSGLISVEPYDQDGRGKRLTITKSGKKMRQEMWTIYGPALKTAISGKLRLAEVQDLRHILIKLNT